MSHLIRLCIITSVVCCLGVQVALAEVPARLGRAGLIQLTGVSANDAGLVPFVAGSAAWRLSSAYERRFDISELDEVYLATLASYSKFSVGLSLANRPGTAYYKETNLNFGLSYSIVNELTLLVGGKLQMITGSGSSVSWDRATLWHGTAGLRFDHSRFHAAVVAERLGHARLGLHYIYEPIGHLYTEWCYAKDYSLLGGATFEKFQTPSFALAHILPLGESVIASLGFRTAPTEYTGGVDIGLGTIHFVYGAAIHPVLGFTHSVGLEAFLGRRSVPSGVFE